jgi:hypothetical protein
MAVHEPWRGLIAEPAAHDHFVQIYRDQRVLIDTIALFAAGALGRNEAVILVATREHGEAVEQRLGDAGFDVPAAKSWGQLAVLDASEVLARFMLGGQPDAARFKAVVGELVGAARASGRYHDVRIYGEMVDLLWSDNLAAAVRLEELWNEVIEEHALSLFCAYCVEAGGQPERVFPPDLRSLHKHLIPVDGCS